MSLQRALLASLAAHAALVTLWLPQPSGLGLKASSPLLVSTHHRHDTSAEAGNNTATAPQTSHTKTRTPVITQRIAEQAFPTVPASASTNTAPASVVAQASPQEATRAADIVAPSAHAETLNADGVRQYRLSLAQAARRLKHYPEAARARNQEGSAEIQVTLGIGAPLVAITRSSGWELLDEAALRMMQSAVRTTPLPESLRGRTANLSLPVRFSLDEL